MLFSAVCRHCGSDLLRWNSSGHQVSHAHQVVGGARERKHPIHLQRSGMRATDLKHMLFAYPTNGSNISRML
jgi:hypothetical protein